MHNIIEIRLKKNFHSYQLLHSKTIAHSMFICPATNIFLQLQKSKSAFEVDKKTKSQISPIKL